MHAMHIHMTLHVILCTIALRILLNGVVPTLYLIIIVAYDYNIYIDL